MKNDINYLFVSIRYSLKFSIEAKIEPLIQEPDRFRTQPAQAQKIKRLV
jgi:hypothetical protein